MNPDGFDDVRLLLMDADPGPLPELDVEQILRDGARRRRRTTRDRWLAGAAVVLVLAGAGAGIAYLERPQQVDPAAPSTPTATRGTVPAPLTPDQWLLYAQVGFDEASSVRYVAELGMPPAGAVTTVDAVLSRGSAQGSVTTGDVTSRYLSVGDVTYVEPAVLEELGLIAPGDAGSALWVRLSPPSESRFRLPARIGQAGNFADFSRWGPAFAEPRVVDGRQTKAVSVDATQIVPGAKIQTFYLDEQAPYLPLLVVRDGREVARYSDWNAPIATPVAPPASEVVDIPGL